MGVALVSGVSVAVLGDELAGPVWTLPGPIASALPASGAFPLT